MHDHGDLRDQLLIEQIAKTRAQRERAELALQRERDEVVDREEMHSRIAEILRIIQTHLAAMPRKIAAETEGAGESKRRDIVQAECDRLLSALASAEL